MVANICHRTLLGVIAGVTVCVHLPDALADSHFSVGVEGFRDKYEEQDTSGAILLDDYTDYYSITAGYLHESNRFFSAIDGRYSYGTDKYKSPISGTESGAPQYEGEIRARTGLEIVAWHGMLMPYIGLGTRLFFDQGKYSFTNSGAQFYDRHITQIYAPIGITYPITSSSGKWIYTPTVEVDPLIWGQVDTHLGEIPGYTNESNHQHEGYGLRGEFMVGQQSSRLGWQAGPFIRYWKINGSDISVDGGYEPYNTRLQFGAALRLTY